MSNLHGDNADHAVCRGCGADIIWGVTTQGKRIPLDAKPEQRFIRQLSEGGTSTWSGAVISMATYQTHFATCPKADEFRKQT